MYTTLAPRSDIIVIGTRFAVCRVARNVRAMYSVVIVMMVV